MRIAVRLALLMASVVLITSFVTFAITVYSGQRNFGELPRDVRMLLQQDGGRDEALPWPVSRQINGLLRSGEEVTIRLEAPVSATGERVFWLHSPEMSAEPVRVALMPPPPRPDIRARLQQSLSVATLVSIVLGGVLALVFARRMARPLEAVSAAATRLAGGELTARIPPLEGADAETQTLARDFNAMAESLEAQERQRKAMVADIAHELRTPLTVLQAKLEALIDGVVPTDKSELERLHRQTGLLSRLVEDLRTLSLADAGQLNLVRKPLDLRKLTQGVVSSFQAQAANRGVRLEVSACEPLLLEADPDRLAQVLSNLLDNALRHTPEGGWVEVGLARADHQARLSVRDSGPGIPEEALPHLFDRFYRADQGRSRESGGSGLGLAIVKTLVELHGGRVEARNRPQGGAEFGVSLPLSR